MSRLIIILVIIVVSSCLKTDQKDSLTINRVHLLDYPNDPGFIFFSLKNTSKYAMYFDQYDIKILFKSEIRDSLEEIPMSFNLFTINDEKRASRADSLIKKEWNYSFKKMDISRKEDWISGRLIFPNDSLKSVNPFLFGIP